MNRGTELLTQSHVFSAMFDTLPLPVLAARKNNFLSVVYLNQAAKANLLPAALRGQTDLLGGGGKPLEQILRFQNPDKFAVFKSSLADMGSVDGMTVSVLSAQGAAQIGRAYAAAALFEDDAYYIICFARTVERGKDETQIVGRMLHAERQSRRSEDIFRTVVDNLEELVYITDIDSFELKFVSKSLVKSLDREPSEVLGRRCWEVMHRGQESRCAYCPVPKLVARAPGDTASHVSELHNDETGKWYMVKNNIVDWIDGKPVHLGALIDISYRKQYEEQLKRFAATDSMTDVYNRKWGHDKLSGHFAAPPEERKNKTLCFFDMDGLKRVNDSLGHALGDEMIINTIQTIFSCIRKDDFIIRWGGDEFVVFLNCNPENAEKVLGKIIFGFEHFNSTRNRPYRISASAGLASFAEPFASLDELIDEADRRMYQNKLLKRNRTGFFLRT